MGICYQGKTLKEAVEEKERLFRESGRAYGLEQLDLVQSDPDGVHYPEGSEERYGNGKRRDQRHPEGQEEYRDKHHRGDGQHELVTQVRYPLLHDFRLIGDEIDLDVRRQYGAQAGEGLLDAVAKLDYVLALLHFD